MPNDQRDETDQMAEGLDLASESVGHGEPQDDRIHTLDKPSTQTDQEPKEADIGQEERYQQERKRKGKGRVKKKPSSKKQQKVNTGVVIKESVQRVVPRQRDEDDSDYTASEESETESDVSLEEEEHSTQQLPDDHHELIHHPVVRLQYRKWRVELSDALMNEMKLYNTQKLQDAFYDKDEGSKDIKSGKVLHFHSLDELNTHEPFLLYMHALGFDWLLENVDPNIPVRLAKEFFTTFRFRVFDRELSMSLIEWTVRLGMCSLEEAIGPEWRSRERGIPRRQVEFEPQEAWEELTHPAAGQFASTISRSIHFNNPILRLVQLYLDFNLLGQSNSAIRTSMTELYLLWCAKRGRRLHLGFWTAYQCHLVATHPVRNLTLCHLLGAFVRNNIILEEAEDLSSMYLVDPPGLFDTPFFVRTNIIYLREGIPRFYGMGEEAVPAGRVPAGQGVRVQAQRQATLEKTVAEMAEENRQVRMELTRLASMMESVLRELAKGKQKAAGPSGHGGQTDEPQEPETEVAEPEEESTEVPAGAK